MEVGRGGDQKGDQSGNFLLAPFSETREMDMK